MTRYTGGELRFRCQFGKRVVFVSGDVSVADLWQFINGPARGGDET